MHIPPRAVSTAKEKNDCEKKLKTIKHKLKNNKKAYFFNKGSLKTNSSIHGANTHANRKKPIVFSTSGLLLEPKIITPSFRFKIFSSR